MGRGIKNAKYKCQVLHAQDPYCWICGQLLKNDMTLDHIIPRSKGGGNGPNLKLAHRKCNGKRGNTDAKVIIDWAFVYGVRQ